MSQEAVVSAEAVSVRQEWQEIPTYVLGPDSPLPVFDWVGWRGMYPYSVLRDYSNDIRPVKHRTAVLENRYVRVVVLPDLGGRIYSLYDKLAEQDVFMVPPSVKFQAVGIRGAWIAGGIELNFGHRSHTVTTVTPVNWAMRTEPDGSASVWVGSVVRPIGSRWSVRVTLRPDAAAMDLDVHTMAPPVLPGMMYWWTNAGVEVTDQSRFFYFGQYANSLHAVHAWPMTDGLDYTWYRNRVIGSDMFLMETERDYLGFYDYGRHHGLAQVADRHQSPGQKYFTWGSDQRGKFWALVFSDSGQSYCEIQRGRHPTQGTTEPMPPMSCESWRETWYPMAGAEGFSAAANDLILSVVPEEGGGATVRLLSATPRRDLRLEAFNGETRLESCPVERVEPGAMFTRRVELPEGGKLDGVKVFDATGRPLMDWQEYVFQDADWLKTNRHDFEPETASTEEIFLEAERSRFASWPRRMHRGGGLYGKILDRDAEHSGAHQALGEQALHAARIDEAIDHFTRALKRRQYDPALRTLLGWALLAAGRDDQACDEFTTAARNEGGRRNALAGLAAVNIRAARWAEADEAVERILAERQADEWGRLLKVIVLRNSGQQDAAVALLEKLLAEDPLWTALHAEALLLGVKVNLADGERSLGDDSVTAAMPYLELGLWADAQAILQVDESNEHFSPAERLALLAAARHKAGDEAGAKKAVEQLRAAPAELAHPWSVTSQAILAQLAEAYADEPMIHVMLGNFLASRNRLEEARAAWQRAADLGLKSAALHRNLAMLAARDNKTEDALAHYRKAWEISPGEINLYTEFDRFLASHDMQAERAAVYEQLPEDARLRPMVLPQRALQLLDTGRHDEALEILTTHTFARAEGDRNVRTLYIESILGKAVELIDAGKLAEVPDVLNMGLEYPRNMHIGRSIKYPDEAVIHYFLGIVSEMEGDDKAARQHWLNAVTEMHLEGSPAQAYEMLAWRALGKDVRASEIAHLLEGLGRGEIKPTSHVRWLYGSGILEFSHGLAQLGRGRIDEAMAMWRELGERKPDLRYIRLHTALPRSILERMCRKVTGPAK